MNLLRNDRITLRALEPEDLDRIFQWENDTELWSVGNTLAPFSRQQIIEYLRDYDTDLFKQKQLRLMVADNRNGEAIGMADLFDFDPFHRRARIGLLIDKNQHNKGFGYETMTLLLQYARDFLGLHQLAADIPASNKPCLHLFIKLGFIQTGILKEWLRTGERYADLTVMQYIFKQGSV